ncbi:MAG: glycine--tRNA ligase [Candidatus Peregrinibacteria bacterium]|nr:glycine--tRNA ligase [Candidatus Peregrinibacteria bacterium]MDZ4244918.1 glycine--tRNA ligase [Candidatus Gracilibacteria bacterium]
MSKNSRFSMEKIVALCKRKGFIYPGSEIYGGLANTWDYGPYGVELKNNVKKEWWNTFIRDRDDMVGLDAAILMNPKTWVASGHVGGFSDPLIDCKKCKERERGDKLLENHMTEAEAAKIALKDIAAKLKEFNVKCPKCGAMDWTEARQFNLMFKTQQGVIEGEENDIYLRPETAQGIFVNFKNVIDSTRVRVPFGIGQIGKAFRNEITPGNFTFRTREFEQMEIEYFVKPGEEQGAFEAWKAASRKWYLDLGVDESHLRFRDHAKEELSHYSSGTCDVEYEFPFGNTPGFGELQGIAIRTDFDLKAHSEHSGQKLTYRDPHTNEEYVPYVIEPSWGCDRTVLMFLCEAYDEEEVGEGDSKEIRTVMRFHPRLAPVKVALFPLHKKLEEYSRNLYNGLKKNGWNMEYDDAGSIGKRYRRQDEIGTPFCVTVDFDSVGTGDEVDVNLKDTVTVRERDKMTQERIKTSDLPTWLAERLQ